MGGGRTTNLWDPPKEQIGTEKASPLWFQMSGRRLPDSTLLSGNAQLRTPAPCVSLPDSWATGGENWPLGLLLLLADLSGVLRTQGPMSGLTETQCDSEAKGIDRCNLESSQPSGTP